MVFLKGLTSDIWLERLTANKHCMEGLERVWVILDEVVVETAGDGNAIGFVFLDEIFEGESGDGFVGVEHGGVAMNERAPGIDEGSVEGDRVDL